ncbi:MAG TPA: DoxX family protein [Beijerinckiaceae bacterium]|nr:DoxX family protein [Beijerinckiaceae bacterium]
MAGAILTYHGYGKLFGGAAPMVATHVIAKLGLPDPLAITYFLGCLEFFGGIAVAIGFLTRPVALMLAVEFVVITHWSFPHGYWFTNPGGGYEFPLVLFVTYIAILFGGGGLYSVDSAIGREF